MTEEDVARQIDVTTNMIHEQCESIGRKIDHSIEVMIRRALRKGDMGMGKIAKEFDVGTGTVQRVKSDMEMDDAVKRFKERLVP